MAAALKEISKFFTSKIRWILRNRIFSKILTESIENFFVIYKAREVPIMERFPKIVAHRPRKDGKHARTHRLNGLDRPVPGPLQGRGPPRQRRVNEKRALNRVRQETLIV